MGFRRLRCAFRRKSPSGGASSTSSFSSTRKTRKSRKTRKQNIAFLLSEIDALQEENCELQSEVSRLRDLQKDSDSESKALKDRLQKLQLGLTAKMADFRNVSKAPTSTRLQEMQRRRIQRTLDRFNSSFHSADERQTMASARALDLSTRTARTEISDSSYLYMDTLDLTMEHSRKSRTAFGDEINTIHEDRAERFGEQDRKPAALDSLPSPRRAVELELELDSPMRSSISGTSTSMHSSPRSVSTGSMLYTLNSPSTPGSCTSDSEDDETGTADDDDDNDDPEIAAAFAAARHALSTDHDNLDSLPPHQLMQGTDDMSDGVETFNLDPPLTGAADSVLDSLDASTLSDPQKVNTVAYYDTTGDSNDSQERFENEYVDGVAQAVPEGRSEAASADEGGEEEDFNDDDSELAVVNGHLVKDYDEIDYSQRGHRTEDDEKVYVNGQAYGGDLKGKKVQQTGEESPNRSSMAGEGGKEEKGKSKGKRNVTQSKSEEMSELDALRRELHQTQIAKDELFCKHARLQNDYQDVIKTLKSALEDVDKLTELTKSKKHSHMAKPVKRQKKKKNSRSRSSKRVDSETDEEDNATTNTNGMDSVGNVSVGDVLCYEHAIRDTLMRKLIKIKDLGHILTSTKNGSPVFDLDTSQNSGSTVQITNEMSKKMERLRNEHRSQISRMTDALLAKDQEISSLQDDLSRSLKSMMTLSAQMEKLRTPTKTGDMPDDASALTSSIVESVRPSTASVASGLPYGGGSFKPVSSSDDMSFIRVLDKNSDRFVRDVESSMRKIETDATDASTVGDMSYDWYFTPPSPSIPRGESSPRSQLATQYLQDIRANSPRAGSPRQNTGSPSSSLTGLPRPEPSGEMSQIQLLRAENFRLKQSFFEEKTRLKMEIRKQADEVQVLKNLKQNQEMESADQSYAYNDDSTSIAYMHERGGDEGMDESPSRRVQFDEESMGYSHSTSDSIRHWRPDMVHNMATPPL